MKFLVDETHNPRGRIFSNYSEFRRLLEKHDHEIDIYDDFPIKHSSIRDSDVLILPCCDGSKLYGHEIKALLRYIEDGCGVFVISHAGGDGGLGTNMNSLTATHFDIEIQSDQVFDEVHSEQDMPSLLLIRDFTPHPVTHGIEQICYIAGCSLRLGQKAQSVVISEPTADPENAPLVAIWDGGRNKKGRIAVTGSYRMFSDYGAGINKYQNAQFALNICEWLAKSTKPRIDMIEQETEPEIKTIRTTKPIIATMQTTEPIDTSPISLSELKKQRSLINVKRIPDTGEIEPETLNTAVLHLPIVEKLVKEIQLLRKEYKKDQKELKEILNQLIESNQQKK